MTTTSARLGGIAIALATGVMIAGCDNAPRPRSELRLATDSFNIRVSPDSTPTRALEPTYWRVVVHDRKTGAPIQGGQGRVFATNRDRKTVANGLEETGELGTYRTNLMFVTQGMWAMSLEFRRDSTLPLQRTQDWTQDIQKANEPGDFSTPQSQRFDTVPPLLPQGKRDSTPPVRKP
ncbi:MAG TPA: hypothetical protein VE869_04535 [Gemmatimonas sp.]|nr:hypothetical protein [Gemmatimonas sp.]